MPHTTCTAQTKAGQPCRAFALPGSDLCAAHSGRKGKAGAPLGNSNARTHGFYDTELTDQELADLVIHAANSTLDDEIALARVALRRLMNYLDKKRELPPNEMAAIAPHVFGGARSVARLLRDRRALSGDAADGLLGAIATALDELGSEWGRDDI